MHLASVTIVSAAVGAGVRVVVVLLRLRWQARQEQLRHQALAGLATRLSAGSWLEDLRADGSRVRITIGDTGAPDTFTGQDSTRG